MIEHDCYFMASYTYILNVSADNLDYLCAFTSQLLCSDNNIPG